MKAFLPLFTVRRLMVAVAVVAIIAAMSIAVERYLSKAMKDFYGPGGYLDRQGKVSLVPTVLRGNAVFDALRRPGGSATPFGRGRRSVQDGIPTEDRGNELA